VTVPVLAVVVAVGLFLLLLAIGRVRARRGARVDDSRRITSRQTLARLEALVRAAQDADPQPALRR